MWSIIPVAYTNNLSVLIYEYSSVCKLVKQYFTNVQYIAVELREL